LKREIAGILNWALEGRRRLYARGRFIEPALSKASIEDYRKDSNPAGLFLREERRRMDIRSIRSSTMRSSERNFQGHSRT
jgi:phage/plasmid-associated DNA primase